MPPQDESTPIVLDIFHLHPDPTGPAPAEVPSPGHDLAGLLSADPEVQARPDAFVVTVHQDGHLLARRSIDRFPIGIGRDLGNEVVLNSSKVSRHHAQIRLDGGRVVVEDLESRNGILVNGSAARVQEVGRGDSIGVGPYTITVHRHEGRAPVAEVQDFHGIRVSTGGRTSAFAMGGEGRVAPGHRTDRVARSIEKTARAESRPSRPRHEPTPAGRMPGLQGVADEVGDPGAPLEDRSDFLVGAVQVRVDCGGWTSIKSFRVDPAKLKTSAVDGDVVTVRLKIGEMTYRGHLALDELLCES